MAGRIDTSGLRGTASALLLGTLLAIAAGILPAATPTAGRGEVARTCASQVDCSSFCQTLPPGYERAYGCDIVYYDGRSIDIVFNQTWTSEEARSAVTNYIRLPEGGPIDGLGDVASHLPAVPNPGLVYTLVFSRGPVWVVMTAQPDSNHSGARSRADSLAREIDSGLARMVAAGCWAEGKPVPATQKAAPTATATPAASVDLQVVAIEVVQAIQTEDNSIRPLVAGKKSVARVFVKATGPPGVKVEGVTAALFVRPQRGGEVDAGAAFNGSISVSTGAEPNRSDTNGSLNFVLLDNLIAAGSYRFRAVVNPTNAIAETNSGNNDYVLDRPIEFAERNNLRIGFVRLGTRPPAETEWAWPEGSIENYAGLMKKLYPAGGSGVEYYEMPWRIRWPSYIATKDTGAYLNWKLREFYDALEGDKPDILVAWVSGKYLGVRTDGQSEIVPSGEVARVAWLVDNGVSPPSESLAHEVGHGLGLQHPGTFVDLDAPECSSAPNENAEYWPKEYGGSSSIRAGGFDTESMSVVPSEYHDVMSYCIGGIWITPFHYQKLYDNNMRPQGTFTASWFVRWWVSGSVRRQTSGAELELVRPPADDAGGGARPQLTASDNPAWARIVSDLVLPLRVAAARQEQPLREGEGDYCLRFTGAGGSALYERCFGLDFQSPESSEPMEEQGFVLGVPDLGSEASQISLRYRDQPLVSRGRSNAPAVSITSPKAGDRWEGEHTITWAGSDADGDSLRYDILYSADGKQSWYPLEIGSRETQYTFSTVEILPSEQTYLRVLASDGFDTAFADAGPFVVPQQAGSPSLPGAPKSLGGWDWWPFLLSAGVALLVAATTMIVLLAVQAARRRRPQPVPLQTGWQTWQTWQTSQVPPAQWYAAQFRQAEAEYRRLQGEYAAGRMSGEQLSATIRMLGVRDAQGRYWTLGPGDGRWYVYDGRSWVRGKPG